MCRDVKRHKTKMDLACHLLALKSVLGELARSTEETSSRFLLDVDITVLAQACQQQSYTETWARTSVTKPCGSSRPERCHA